MCKKTVVFKSSSLIDITMSITKGYWEHTKYASNIEEGDTVMVIPTKGALKDSDLKPYTLFGRFIGSEDGDDNNWEDKNQSYTTRYNLEDITLVPFNVVEGLIQTGQCASSIRYIDVNKKK